MRWLTLTLIGFLFAIIGILLFGIGYSFGNFDQSWNRLNVDTRSHLTLLEHVRTGNSSQVTEDCQVILEANVKMYELLAHSYLHRFRGTNDQRLIDAVSKAKTELGDLESRSIEKTLKTP